jgi:acetyl esterase/lipase
LATSSVPTLTVYHPPKAKDTGAAVLVFPGGGYSILALDLEGTEICEWLNSIGITAVLVKYRVPARAGRPRYAAPLEDAQRAMGIVRGRAGELGVDPKRIGVLGFSAGGHLAAAALTGSSLPPPISNGEPTNESIRPMTSVAVPISAFSSTRPTSR